MHNQEPALYYDASDTYRGPLRSFFGIDPDYVGEKNNIARLNSVHNSKSLSHSCPTMVSSKPYNCEVRHKHKKPKNTNSIGCRIFVQNSKSLTASIAPQ